MDATNIMKLYTLTIRLYILQLPNGKVEHALTYWPNVGAFDPSVPQPPNLTSLRKLKYNSARTNVLHAPKV